MRRKDGLDTSARVGGWTRPDAYLTALANKRTFRRARRELRRSQPEQPRPMLSTVPLALVLALLAVLAVGIMILAFPGNQPQQRPRQVAATERGVAARGWFQEAQKEMHR